MQERLASAPGVDDVSFASRVPLGATGPSGPFHSATGPARGAQEFRFVAPGFFRTMGIRLVAIVYGASNGVTHSANGAAARA